MRRRWQALSREQRAAATQFDDPQLLRNIREAVQYLYQQQALMARILVKSEGAEVCLTDLCLGSPALTEVFDLPWVVERCDELDAMLMDPDAQPACMTLRESILEGEVVFSCMTSYLPDFLGARTGRCPLPRARWKQFWSALPFSVGLLEKQLAELLEQSLWAMASSPAYQIQEHTIAPEIVGLDLEVALEDWMIEPPGGVKSPKVKKKKKKTHAQEPKNTFATVQQEIETQSLAGADDHKPAQDGEVGKVLPRGEEDISPPPPPSADRLQQAPWVAEPTPSSSCQCSGERDSMRSILQDHYWTSKVTKKPALEWCLPTPWSRGYWAPSDDGSRAIGTRAVVRNTFIDLEDGSAQSAESRASRSLSPGCLRAVCADYVSSLSTNEWYR